MTVTLHCVGKIQDLEEIQKFKIWIWKKYKKSRLGRNIKICSRGDILASLSGSMFDMVDGNLTSATGSLNIWLLRS